MKPGVYARHRVAHAWIVDFEQQALDVRALHEGSWRDTGCFRDRDVVRAEPFPEIEIPLGYLWGDRPSLTIPRP